MDIEYTFIQPWHIWVLVLFVIVGAAPTLGITIWAYYKARKFRRTSEQSKPSESTNDEK